MTRAGCYLRVSTDEQAEKAKSIPDQLAACEAAAGGPFAVVDQDPGIPGWVWPRPGMLRLLEAAQRGEITELWAWDWKRIARDADLKGYLTTMLRLAGCRIRVVDGAGASALEVNIRSAMAQEETRSTRAAVRRAMHSLARDRKNPGGRSVFGYRWEAGQRVIVPSEASRLVAAVEAIEAGESAAKVARDQGLSNSRIYDVLRSPVIAGAYVYGRTRVPEESTSAHARLKGTEPLVFEWGAHPAIIERARWEALQALLDSRTQQKSRYGTLALTGLLQCRCGGPGEVSTVCRPRYTDRWYLYRCRDCGSSWNTRGWVASIVRSVARYCATPEVAARIAAHANAGNRRTPDAAELGRLERAERAIIDLASDGTIDAGEARRRLAPLRAQRPRLESDRRGVRPVTAAEVRSRLLRVAAVLESTAGLPDLEHAARPALRLALRRIVPTGPGEADLTLRTDDATPSQVALRTASQVASQALQHLSERGTRSGQVLRWRLEGPRCRR